MHSGCQPAGYDGLTHPSNGVFRSTRITAEQVARLFEPKVQNSIFSPFTCCFLDATGMSGESPALLQEPQLL